MTSPTPYPSGSVVRAASRNNTLTSPTPGLAPGFIQANLLVLPAAFAADFRLLCARNPVPCPLLAESAGVGDFASLKSHLPSRVRLISELGGDAENESKDDSVKLDLRRDCTGYNVYQDSTLVSSGSLDVVAQWTAHHVAFLVGCSFSFETALSTAGLPPRHSVQGRNVPMYRTKIPLCSAGVFQGGTYVVSMRPYRASDVERVRTVTRAYTATHGEPIAWGWSAVAELGIGSLSCPEWGDPPLNMDGTDFDGVRDDRGVIPVFWGCGVTTQEAVMKAGLQGTVMAHAPGHMLVLDCRDEDIVSM